MVLGVGWPRKRRRPAGSSYWGGRLIRAMADRWAIRVVPVPNRDQVTGPLDDNGVPPAAFRRLFRYHDMTWSDFVPATRYFLGCGIWTCRWVHVGQIGRDQVQVQGALDIRYQASAARVQATGREL